jgi:hypothetical protein
LTVPPVAILARARAGVGGRRELRHVGQAAQQRLQDHQLGDAAHLGFGRIVASETEAPNMFVNLV